jgi:acetyl-CoA acetyltransferase
MTSGGHFKLMDNFSRGLRNYGTPLGFGGANGLFAIIQRKHMETYGTRIEDLGRIAVDQRKSAQYNEAALLRGPMTIDDYINARMIADPLRLYDCVLPCAGAEAVVVTTLDRASPGKGVRVVSGYERHNHPKMEIAPLRGGWETFAGKLYADAGYGPGDMDFVQLYDDYPIMVAIQFEDLGFCAKGEVSKFLADNSFHFQRVGAAQYRRRTAVLRPGRHCRRAVERHGGRAPVAREAGGRQVENATRGLVAGYGMVGYGHGLPQAASYWRQADDPCL